ncbi:MULTISPECIES: hypothetical protein [unclassified Exiguobacterium]|uniref:hypothetical protein n=1 Tax=unclassified Exiguobacterium TaxID=2644629 RepID=UPI001BE6F26B|nr:MULTISPECIES: hypothetical protein [unclassified Exiguobacterium]
MNVLIGQPKMERNLEQLKLEIESNPTVDLILYPEGYCTYTELDVLGNLAIKFNTSIVLGYRDDTNKDRVLIINKKGETLLTRRKTPENELLFMPSNVTDELEEYGYLLCREIFMGSEGLKTHEQLSIIFNPIGVGMFSEEQFTEWSEEARKIAMERKAMIIGTSHADGSYRNCGFSIPIAYCFDENGEEVFLSKNDTRTRVLETDSRVTTFV